MKQHITAEQLNELSEKEKEILIKWSAERNYGSYVEIDDWDYGLLSIGQMIEFLDDDYINVLYEYDNGNPAYAESVCDALWEAVKKILKKE